MTIDEFNQLSDDDKEEAIDNHGMFLASYDVCNAICDAYELFDFYVAFVYEIGVNKRAHITAHPNPDELPMLLRIHKIM
jgi:hypothetical protein